MPSIRAINFLHGAGHSACARYVRNEIAVSPSATDAGHEVVHIVNTLSHSTVIMSCGPGDAISACEKHLRDGFIMPQNVKSCFPKLYNFYSADKFGPWSPIEKPFWGDQGLSLKARIVAICTCYKALESRIRPLRAS